MYDVEQLKGKLVITPVDYKEKILKEISQCKKLIPIKFMTIETFIDHYLFTYDKQAIYYLMKTYRLHYDVACQYLKHLKYVGDTKESNIPNIQKLIELKQELSERNLLYFDHTFCDYIKTKPIEIIGYELSEFQKHIFEELRTITSVHITTNAYIIQPKNVFHFATIESELEFIMADICQKLEQNVPIEKFYLTNVTSEYFLPLKKICECIGIAIEDPQSHTLYGTTIVKKALSRLGETKNKEETVKELQSIIAKNQDYNIVKQFISLLNEYSFCEVDSTLLECLIQECKRISIQRQRHTSAITIQSIDYLYPEDSYVYWVGMNSSSIPNIVKDEDYLNDSCCEQLHIDTSFDRNKIEREKCIKCIYSIPNLTITYKDTTPFESYYPSPLIEELNLLVIEGNCEAIYRYSDCWNQIQLGKKLDRYVVYNEHDSILYSLWAHYPNISYRNYQHTYETISKEEFYNYIDQKLLLSYSSIDNYYRCGFRYYIENILKLTRYEETFLQQIGNLFHHFLALAFQENFNFEAEWIRYHEKRKYSAKERFFLKKLKGELQFVINTIEEQNSHSLLKEARYEQKIYKNIPRMVSVTFMGIIDKIQYQKENGIIYATIVDYKTGNVSIQLNNCIHGINMQLPIYLYLMNHIEEKEHIQVIGFYLQKILTNEFLNTENSDYMQMKRDSLKLEGYSIDQEQLVQKIDDTYLDSRLIKGMKMGSNGFYAYTKIMSEKKMNQLSQLVEQKIHQAIDAILDTKFDINPKQIGNHLVGCEYCKYRDLCFHDERDIVYLKEYKNLEFLEEDEHE